MVPQIFTFIIKSNIQFVFQPHTTNMSQNTKNGNAQIINASKTIKTSLTSSPVLVPVTIIY